jgi:acyl carrier protein
VIFERSSYEEYTNVVKPKVDGAWNLHHAFRDLEFFIMLGSVASIIGNRGQAAYSAASTFLSALAQTRISQGLPAATISLGAVQGVGYIADNSTTQASMDKHLGLHFIDEGEVHALIHAAIRTQIGATRSNHEWISGLRLKLGNQEPFWLGDPKFAHVRRAQLAVESEHSVTGQNVSVGQQLKRAKSLDEAQGSVCKGLLGKISGVLMVAIEDLNIDAPMATYGLDSLVAVEIRNWVVREFDVSVSVFDLLSGNTLRMVAELIVKKSKLVDRALLQTENEG